MNDGSEVLIADESQWNSFLSKAANPVPFSSSWWRNAICELFDYSADYLLLCRHGEFICGTIAYYAKGKTRFAKHPYLTPYNTIIYSNAVDADKSKAISVLLDYIKKKYYYPYFVFDTGAILLYSDVSGWNVSNGSTYIVDPSTTKLDNNIIRRSKKCESEGFYVNFTFMPHAFVGLYMQTVKRQRIAVMPDETRLIRFIEALNASGFVWMASCYDAGGKLHASWMQVVSDDILYNWNAASDSSLMNKGGTSFLVTQMLSEIRKKYRKWDLCGADIPSVAKFKKGIGGDLVSYQKIYFNDYSIAKKAVLRIKKIIHS